jgi:hypothetical protein
MSVHWRIENYIRRSGITPTKFGRLAAGDPMLVHDLRRGREPRAPMVARIEAFLDLHEAGR